MEALKLYKSTKSLVGLQEFEDFKSTLNENSEKISKLEDTVTELTSSTDSPTDESAARVNVTVMSPLHHK